jgi:hypothetical protein
VILNIYFCGNPYTFSTSKLFSGRKKMEKEKLTLRVKLKGENAKKFTAIKQRYGLKNNTEIIRFLISQEYAKIEGQKNSSPKK